MLNRQRDIPRISTELPGHNAKKLIEADEQFTSPSYTREYPLAVASGRGAIIEDVDGNQFLDFTAGIAVCSTGHCHPRIVQAICEQSQRLIHMSGTDFYYAPQKDLAKRLAELAPGASPKRVFFTNSGTESVEAALKLARYHTRRQQIIAFFGAFHGRTMGALSLTASKVTQRDGFAPLVPGVTHVHYANCYRCPINLSSESCRTACVDQFENLFQRTVPAEEVAAIVVEPIQGEGGYIVPPDDFLGRLREVADQHGILLIADEVQAGMGRTGKMFASEHWGFEPDIICTAKGIASGLPLGAIIAREEVMNWKPGSHASTFGGNPVSCAAALATIDLLEEDLMHNAEVEGEFLISRLRTMMSRHDCIGDVRGKGLMIGVDLVRDLTSKEGDTELRDDLVQRCFRKGLLLLGCGASAIRLCPPLIISRQHSETAVAILEDALNEIR